MGGMFNYPLIRLKVASAANSRGSRSSFFWASTNTVAIHLHPLEFDCVGFRIFDPDSHDGQGHIAGHGPSITTPAIYIKIAVVLYGKSSTSSVGAKTWEGNLYK